MAAEEFAKALKKVTIEESLEATKRIYMETDIKNVTSPYYKEALTLFNQLTDEQKEIFFKVIKNSFVDTVSTMLGVINGSVISRNIPDLQLLDVTNPDAPEPLEYVQDYFLSEIENEEK